jgi:catechol 2,3-dioxygenase-like lactoylglutathione lyase family enzyme
MIRVRKIAHVAYETPDIERQTDYYTEVIGLSLIA